MKIDSEALERYLTTAAATPVVAGIVALGQRTGGLRLGGQLPEQIIVDDEREAA